MSYCLRPSRQILTLSIALSGLLGASPIGAQPDGCNAAAPDAIVHLQMPGAPFEPVITPDGCFVFVTLAANNQQNAGGIAVVRRSGGALHVVRTIDLKGSPTGAVLTHDGKWLIVAAGGYVAFVDATRLITGDGDPVLGYVGNGSPVGFIYVNVTADDRILFAAAERAAAVLVVSLERVRAGGFGDGAAIGKIDVGNAPISVTLSPDGKYLYTTSESSLPEWGWPNVCKPEAVNAPGRGRARRGAPPPYHGKGAILVVDVAQAVTGASHAVVSRIAAGCEPVRLVLSPDGSVAYVSARGDNELLAFDAHRLISDTAHALLGHVAVGPAPVGVAVVDSGARIVVTNSNRFAGTGSAHQQLAVVNSATLLAGGSAAVVGVIPAGGFPRELRLTADERTLFVTNFASRRLEMIDVARTPGARERQGALPPPHH